MKNIIYFNQNDAEKFDYDRFKKSLNDYAKVPDADIKADFRVVCSVRCGVCIVGGTGGEQYMSYQQQQGCQQLP